MTKNIFRYSSKDAVRRAIADYESKMKESPVYQTSEEIYIIKGLYQALKELEKYDQIRSFINVK